MTIQQTPDLKIKSASNSPGPPRKITFKFVSPYQPLLYLGILTLVENTQITGYSGSLNPGNPNQAGNGTIQVNHAKFDAFWNFLSQPQLELVITYDDTNFTVIDMELTSNQPSLAMTTLTPRSFGMSAASAE
jgi:hypothetical protein